MKQNRIAITGGIGSGKTEVVKILRKKGYVVLSADEISREVSNDTKVLNKIKTTFGEEFVIDGKLDRAKLRQYVFSSETLTDKLNEIMHPIIKQKIKERIASESGKTVFVEIPLYESEMQKFYSSIWLITAPLEVRYKRITSRDEIDITAAEDIIKRQLSKQVKAKNADVVILNDGTLDELEKSIEKNLVSFGYCAENL